MAKDDKNDTGNDIAPVPAETIATSKHTLVLGDETLSYTATAGTMLIREEDEKKGHAPKASIFYTAYTLDDAQPGSRPITFAFNGGPGSSSVWLHLGVLGPRRVEFDSEGAMLQPPYRLIDNPQTLLDVSDLVFIDPVSTGFSRPIPGEEAKQYHNFKKDIEAVGEFIRLYCTRYSRWSSPKFLCGESYGTTRAAGLSGFLQNEYGMFFNGLMLISSVLHMQTLRFGPGNDLPFILILPSYCATAWYHNKLTPELQADLQQTLREVEKFALEQYAPALMQGRRLDNVRRRELADNIARYIGLTPEFVERSNLRVDILHFAKELLRSERRTVGRLDSRFKGIDRHAVGDSFEFDPSYTNILGPYTATLNDYLRRELAYETDLPYEILTAKVHPWNYEQFQNQFVDVAETLRSAISRNPFLKVFIANGYYDLATPYFATEYTVNHLQLDSSLHDNIRMAYYEAGHMMYVHQPSLEQLKDDLANFVNRSTQPDDNPA